MVRGPRQDCFAHAKWLAGKVFMHLLDQRRGFVERRLAKMKMDLTGRGIAAVCGASTDPRGLS
jgi:hypothetical protein